MWFVVKTDFYSEDKTRQELMALEGVLDVYLPIHKRTIEARARFVPTISGILLVNIDPQRIHALVNHRGYFHYTIPGRDPLTGATIYVPVQSHAHLLSLNPGEATQDEIIQQAQVPQHDVDRLRLFNERQAEGIPDLTLIDIDYQQISQQNDIVLITEGPYLGIEGVVRRVKQKGKKDRRLLFSIGCWTICVPHIHTHRYVVIREAREGKKAQEVNTYRHIDLLIGRLQALTPSLHDDAPRQLRALLRALNHDVRLDDYTQSLHPDHPTRRLIDAMDTREKSALITLSRYFQTYDRSIDLGLADLIPDNPLRPFLTPGAELNNTSSGPSEHEPKQQARYTLVAHDGFTELILPIDLRPYFILPPAENEAPDAYTYQAHVALFLRPTGRYMAVVSWGEFIRQYLLKTPDQREALIHEFEAHGYPRTVQLLSTHTPYEGHGIFGFAQTIDATEGPNIEGHNIEGQSIGGQAIEGQNIEDKAIEGQNIEDKAIEGQAIEGQNIEGHNIEGQNIGGHNIEETPAKPYIHGRGRPCVDPVQHNETQYDRIIDQDLRAGRRKVDPYSFEAVSERHNIEGQSIEGQSTEGHNIEDKAIEGQNKEGQAIEGHNIGGPTPDVPIADVLPTVLAFVHELAPSAVELWQGTGLLSWRKYAQRWVLLHKKSEN